MSARREALERAYEREEESLQRSYDEGRLTPEQYRAEMRELQRSAQEDARYARDEDIADALDNWRW